MQNIFKHRNTDLELLTTNVNTHLNSPQPPLTKRGSRLHIENLGLETTPSLFKISLAFAGSKKSKAKRLGRVQFSILNSLLTAFLIVNCQFSILNSQSLTQIHPPIFMDGKELAFGTVGGLSAPQYSEVDLNNDGIQDLYIYDKIGEVGLTFLNGGTANEIDYTYAPEYLTNFPALNEWVLLRDYNRDGIQDIFAYSSIPGVPGIEVHTGYYDAQGRIAFRAFKFTQGLHNIIYYPGNVALNNLFVSNIDYPAVDDIDGDGDLDIVTFNLAGGIVELYANQSVERGYGLDSLQFILADDCWGGFFESGISLAIDLGATPDDCAGRFRSNENSESRNGGLHAGSTVLTLDMDNDGDKEVMLGDISFTNLTLLTNGGTVEKAHMTAQEVVFPSNTVSVNIPLFPAAFHLDINNDGLKDIVAAPNLGNDIGETELVGWYYANTNTNENPVFEYRTNTLLVGEMVDLGTGSNPVFVDVNADGLQDLVVGNKSFFVPGGDKNARIYLFINVGNAANPSFALADDNYLGMNDFSNSSWRFSPTFGDLDSDGDLDVLIGEEFGELFFAENTAGAGQPFEFGPIRFGYQEIDIGQVSKPQIIDMNKDGLQDLVVGERNGNVNYFENIGTPTEAKFDLNPTNRSLGAIDVREEGYVTGYSSPIILQIGDEQQLFSGSQTGDIRRYVNLDDNLFGLFLETESNYGQLQLGGESQPSFADINNDGFYEMVVGNIRGGLQFFETDLRIGTTTSTSTTTLESNIELFPNPTRDQLSLSLPPTLSITRIEIFNSIGQLMQSTTSTTFSVSELKAGVYLITVETDQGVFSERFIKL